MLKQMVKRVSAVLPNAIVVYRRARTSLLVIGGTSAVDFGVWQWSHVGGWIVGGVSLLVLEWLTEGETE